MSLKELIAYAQKSVDFYRSGSTTANEDRCAQWAAILAQCFVSQSLRGDYE